jgi:copper(I)-binding protein
MQRMTRLSAVVLVALIVAGCSSAGGSPSPSAGGSLTVTDAWARAAAVVDRPGGAYLVIHNATAEPDALIGASSPAAATIEVHETTRDSGGMMGMHAIPRLEVAAGESVALAPGGFHLMLIGLTGPLKVGDTIDLTLRFERAGPITVQAAVREG